MGWPSALAALATVALPLVLLHRPLGDYMAWVFTSPRDWRVERAIYRLVGVDPAGAQTWRGYLTEAASALGAPAPLVLPSGVLRLAAPYAARIMADLDLRVSSELAHRELGWTPRYPSVREGWRAEV